MKKSKEHRVTSDKMNGSSEWGIIYPYCEGGARSRRRCHWVRVWERSKIWISKDRRKVVVKREGREKYQIKEKS